MLDKNYGYLALLFLVACGGPAHEEFDATSDDELTVGIYDPCLGRANGAADETIFMGSNTTTVKRSVLAADYRSGYNIACPGRWSAQVNVPSYSSGCSNCGESIDVAVGLYSFPNMVASSDSDFPVPNPGFNNPDARCQSYRVFGSVYYRSSNRSSFKRVQTFDLRGVWQSSGYCRVENITTGNVGNVIRTLIPPSRGTRQYKFLVHGAIDGATEDLRIRARHPKEY